MAEKIWRGGMIRLNAGGVKFENRRDAPPEPFPKNSNDMKTIIKMLTQLSDQDLFRLQSFIDAEVRSREIEKATFSTDATDIAKRGLAQLSGK